MSGSRLIMFDGWGSTAHKQAVRNNKMLTIHPDARNTTLAQKSERLLSDQHE